MHTLPYLPKAASRSLLSILWPSPETWRLLPGLLPASPPRLKSHGLIPQQRDNTHNSLSGISSTAWAAAAAATVSSAVVTRLAPGIVTAIGVCHLDILNRDTYRSRLLNLIILP